MDTYGRKPLLARLEFLHGRLMKVGVVQVDLVTQHELAARSADALAQRLAVVGLADAERTQLGVFVAERAGERRRLVAGPVLRQDHLVVPAQGRQAFAQVNDR